MAEIIHDELDAASEHASAPASDVVGDRSLREQGSRRLGYTRRPAQTALKAVTDADTYVHANGAVADLDDELDQLRALVGALDVKLREQVEIERMRDLELGRLEHELEQKAERLASVEVELFHERRRSAELERRWNVLARSYEDTAASLVETGAKLAAISSQRSYRTIVAVLRTLGRNRGTEALVTRASSRLHRGDAS